MMTATLIAENATAMILFVILFVPSRPHRSPVTVFEAPCSKLQGMRSLLD
jgi:hypothetical protein